MQYSMLVVALLASCIYTVTAQECGAEDDTVYRFSFGYSWGPYEYLNDDYELMGLGPSVVRSVCRIMNKKCEYPVSFHYENDMNADIVSISLNNDWYDANVNWIPTKKRQAAYDFFGMYANEPAAFLFVRRRSSINDIEDVGDADTFGLREGIRLNVACLESYLGMSLRNKEVKFYDNAEGLEAALSTGEVDVMFMDDFEVTDRNEVRVVTNNNEAISCSDGNGPAIMVKKGDLPRFTWFDEGFAKIRANGDYDWLCNIASRDAEPYCFE